MDTCKNCGKPLENPDQELCPACRAVENAKARTRREEKAGHARRGLHRPVRHGHSDV